MSQQQAKYLCSAARSEIDAAIGQGWALAFPTASATLYVAANYLSAAAGELGGDANLVALGAEVAGKANEILAIGLVPWPFVYAGIGPWANALADIKSRIPDIVILEPAGVVRPATPALAKVPTFAPPPFGAMSPAAFAGMPVAAKLFVGKGPKGHRRSDDRICEDACAALTADPFVDASDVDVSVRDGKARLRGKVENRAAKRRAEDVVLGVMGVADVDNELEVVA